MAFGFAFQEDITELRATGMLQEAVEMLDKVCDDLFYFINWIYRRILSIAP